MRTCVRACVGVCVCVAHVRIYVYVFIQSEQENAAQACFASKQGRNGHVTADVADRLRRACCQTWGFGTSCREAHGLCD